MKIACFKVGIFLSFLLMSISAWSQTKSITGTVISGEDNKPLSKVSVQVKGKTGGTVTNENGEFKISVSDQDVLVFSFSGYTPDEVRVGTSLHIDVTLKSSNELMGEVVVVGYGTQKRKEFAGASTTVNPLATKFTPSSNVGTALQGTVPGLLV